MQYQEHLRTQLSIATSKGRYKTQHAQQLQVPGGGAYIWGFPPTRSDICMGHPQCMVNPSL